MSHMYTGCTGFGCVYQATTHGGYRMGKKYTLHSSMQGYAWKCTNVIKEISYREACRLTNEACILVVNRYCILILLSR